jgi:hypothetical protein
MYKYICMYEIHISRLVDMHLKVWPIIALHVLQVLSPIMMSRPRCVVIVMQESIATDWCLAAQAARRALIVSVPNHPVFIAPQALSIINQVCELKLICASVCVCVCVFYSFFAVNARLLVHNICFLLLAYMSLLYIYITTSCQFLLELC